MLNYCTNSHFILLTEFDLKIKLQGSLTDRGEKRFLRIDHPPRRLKWPLW